MFLFFSCPPPNLVSGSSRRIWNPESESKPEPEHSSRFWRRHGQWNWRAKFWNSESSQLDLCQSCWWKQSDRRTHEHECLKFRNRTQITVLRKYLPRNRTKLTLKWKQSDCRSNEHEFLKSRNRRQITILRKYYSETEHSLSSR